MIFSFKIQIKLNYRKKDKLKKLKNNLNYNNKEYKNKGNYNNKNQLNNKDYNNKDQLKYQKIKNNSKIYNVLIQQQLIKLKIKIKIVFFNY